MGKLDEAASADLVPWLVEVARRPWPAQARRVPRSNGATRESGEQLLAYLEELAERPLRSRKAIESFVAEGATQSAQAWRMRVRRSIARQTAVLGALMAAFLTFYFLDVSLQIQSMQKATFYVPQVQQRSVKA